MKAINRWQKVWLILSLLFFLIYLPLAWRQLPTKAQIEDAWANALIAVITKQPNNTYQFRDTYYPEMPSAELILRLTNTYSKYDDIYALLYKENNKYKAKIENLWADNALPALVIFLIGFSVVAAVYALGAALGWLIKRLKKSRLYQRFEKSWLGQGFRKK